MTVIIDQTLILNQGVDFSDILPTMAGMPSRDRVTHKWDEINLSPAAIGPNGQFLSARCAIVTANGTATPATLVGAALRRTASGNYIVKVVRDRNLPSAVVAMRKQAAELQKLAYRKDGPQARQATAVVLPTVPTSTVTPTAPTAPTVSAITVESLQAQLAIALAAIKTTPTVPAMPSVPSAPVKPGKVK